MSKKENKILDPKSSPVARGKRLRSLRMMTSLSRKEVYQKFKLSSSTQQSWEDAKAGGLTRKGAKRAVEVFRKAGVRCSEDWLLYGVGAPPQLMSYEVEEKKANDNAEENTSYGLEDKGIIKELLAFRESNHDAVDFVITDDGMGPHYASGDYVGGKRRYNDEIKHLIGQDCIVETANNDVLLRRIRPGARENLYTLICINPDTTIKDVVLYDQQLLSAATVLWHRRQEKLRFEKPALRKKIEILAKNETQTEKN